MSQGKQIGNGLKVGKISCPTVTQRKEVNLKDSSDVYLHGILQDEVFALLQFEALVNDTAQYTPGVIHVQIDL